MTFISLLIILIYLILTLTFSITVSYLYYYITITILTIRPFAKPLVVMSAKWLLHHKPCTSRIEDLTEGTFFQRLILEGGRGDNMNKEAACK